MALCGRQGQYNIQEQGQTNSTQGRQGLRWAISLGGCNGKLFVRGNATTTSPATFRRLQSVTDLIGGQRHEEIPGQYPHRITNLLDVQFERPAGHPQKQCALPRQGSAQLLREVVRLWNEIIGIVIIIAVWAILALAIALSRREW